MTIKITLSNISGFTGEQGVIPVESEFYLPSAVESVDNFTVDVKVEGVYENVLMPEEPIYVDADDVRPLYDFTQIGITYTKLSNSVFRLSGIGTNIFTDQYYRFKMTDYSEKILPPTIEEPFFGLIKYQMPNPTYTMLSYLFEADLPGDLNNPPGTEEFTLNQWFFWYYQTAVNNVLSLNQRGLK